MHKLNGDELVTLGFEAADNLTNQSPLHTIRLHGDEGPLANSPRYAGVGRNVFGVHSLGIGNIEAISQSTGNSSSAEKGLLGPGATRNGGSLGGKASGSNY